MKVVSLSALRTGSPYTPENVPGTHLCYRVSRPQGYSAEESIMSIRNFNDTIRNRTRDLLEKHNTSIITRQLSDIEHVSTT